MSSKSNDQGRAFEYITLVKLWNRIREVRDAEIEKNSSYYASEKSWNNISQKVKQNLERAAISAVETIIDLEPLILEDGDDTVNLLIQPDTQGKEGDVRDILIIRRDIQWEIGLSIKHNHFAAKHSRLAKTLDFGRKWYDVPCSESYWKDVAPVFNFLEEARTKQIAWKDLSDKENDVYIPLLNAFLEEIKRSDDAQEHVPRKMVEYLLGKYDFYKVISVDNLKITQILTFNLRGTLNKNSASKRPEYHIPVAALPTRIVWSGFKPGSKNTVEIYMDGGWQFSFRIHNASTIVEPSLKFDIQIIGMPTTIVAINSIWR